MQVLLCPQCRQAKLDGLDDRQVVRVDGGVDDAHVRCLHCGWTGRQSEVYGRQVPARLAGGDAQTDVLKAVVDDLLAEMVKTVTPRLGQCLFTVGLYPWDEYRRQVQIKVDGGDGDCLLFDEITQVLKAGTEGAWRAMITAMTEFAQEQVDAKKFN